MLDTFGIDRHANDSMFEKIAAASGARLTLIAPNGAVMADSDADAATMENHAQRREVAEALSGRTGSDTRMSQTVHQNFLYVAIPVQTGALRLAIPLREVEAQVREIRNQLLAAVALAFLPAILLAALFARYVSSKLAAIIDYAGRLARGEFTARLKSARPR